MGHVVHHVLLPARLSALPGIPNLINLAFELPLSPMSPVIKNDVASLGKAGQGLCVVWNSNFFRRDALRVRLSEIRILPKLLLSLIPLVRIIGAPTSQNIV